MEIQKLSEKYNFYKEGVNYILDLGKKKREEDTTTELLITGIEDSKLLDIVRTCGCSSVDKEIVDQNTQSVKIKYTQCDPSFAKIMEIKYKNVKIGTIKIKGTCVQ